eukprot:4237885-Alexandrium_andersonii.AAC.1
MPKGPQFRVQWCRRSVVPEAVLRDILHRQTELRLPSSRKRSEGRNRKLSARQKYLAPEV